MLGHVSDQCANGRTIRYDVVSHHLGTAGTRIDQAEQQLDKRALAGAVGADKSGNSCFEIDSESIERQDVAVALR